MLILSTLTCLFTGNTLSMEDTSSSSSEETHKTYRQEHRKSHDHTWVSSDHHIRESMKENGRSLGHGIKRTVVGGAGMIGLVVASPVLVVTAPLWVPGTVGALSLTALAIFFLTEDND